MTEILILGAGYTGMGATMALAGRLRGRDDVHITLVNPQTRFTERLRLHQTASGQALADLEIPDRLAGTGVEFIAGWVTAIDADAQTVRIDDEFELTYDTLVYALGSVADTESMPGVDRVRLHPQQRARRRTLGRSESARRGARSSWRVGG